VTVTGGGVTVFVAGGVVADFEQDANRNIPAVKTVNKFAFIQLSGV
jgi:hypothetical protein